MILHASVFAALYAMQAAPTPFSQAGQSQIISIQATRSPLPSTSELRVEAEVLTLTSKLESQDAPLLPTQLTDRDRLSEPLREPRQRDLPQLSFSAAVPVNPHAEQPIWKRRRVAEKLPPVTPIEKIERRAMKRLSVVQAPLPTAIQIEQFVGLEKESSADLSANQPPAYPAEAIRLRLEGVAMLQLRITVEGRVEDVTLIKSSGHRVLDEAAISAVATWTGEPAKRWGRAVESVERLPIRFRL